LWAANAVTLNEVRHLPTGCTCVRPKKGQKIGQAAALGASRVTLRRVINEHEHARNSPNLAVRLESAGVDTARGWRAMQMAHDLAGERDASLPKVRELGTVA